MSQVNGTTDAVMCAFGLATMRAAPRRAEHVLHELRLLLLHPLLGATDDLDVDLRASEAVVPLVAVIRDDDQNALTHSGSVVGCVVRRVRPGYGPLLT